MKTSAKDFALFKAECERWQEKLSLGDWHFYYGHFDLGRNARATVSLNVPNRVASLTLNTDWADGNRPTAAAITESAKHEVIHVLLADLTDLHTRRLCTPEMQDQAEHAVIRRLEKVL